MLNFIEFLYIWENDICGKVPQSFLHQLLRILNFFYAFLLTHLVQLTK